MKTITRISFICIILGMMSACGSEHQASNFSSSTQALSVDLAGSWLLVEVNGFLLEEEDQLELQVVSSLEQVQGCAPSVLALLSDDGLQAVTQSLNSCFVHYDADSPELGLSADLTDISFYDVDSNGDLVVESASGTRYVFSR